MLLYTGSPGLMVVFLRRGLLYYIRIIAVKHIIKIAMKKGRKSCARNVGFRSARIAWSISTQEGCRRSATLKKCGQGVDWKGSTYREQMTAMELACVSPCSLLLVEGRQVAASGHRFWWEGALARYRYGARGHVVKQLMSFASSWRPTSRARPLRKSRRPWSVKEPSADRQVAGEKEI